MRPVTGVVLAVAGGVIARALVVLVAVGVPACSLHAGDDTPTPPTVSKVERKAVPISPRRAIDLLLVVDTAPSMAGEQAMMELAMPAFVNVVTQLEGGLPSVHIGVVTSDVGTLGVDVGDASCAGDGDGGAFVAADCGIDGDFLIHDFDLYGNALVNFTGSAADALACVGAELDAAGCGFRQPLEAMRRALERGKTNGFLRRYAELYVMFLGDGDDCSSLDATFFDGARTFGPFACFAEGVICDGDQPARLGAHTGCREREGGRLGSLAEYERYLTSLKADPRDVIVAVVTGPTTSVVVEPGPVLATSCATGAIAATPGIRLASFAERFTDRWVMTTTCSDWTNALTPLAGWWDGGGYPCWEGVLRDVDADAPGLQPSCAAWLELGNGVEVVVPACDAGGAGTWCYRLVVDDVNCGLTPTRLTLQLDPPGVLEPSTLWAECEVE